MKYDPAMIPEFLNQLEKAEIESEIQSTCLDLMASVAERWTNENSRRKPMSEIRTALRERFPSKRGKSKHDVPFPYYFTSSGKGNVPRWEHLGIKHLAEKYNSKVESTEEVMPVLTTDSRLDSLGLSDEELEVVKAAVADADIKEWIKQAVIQRANTINKLRESLDADWSSISSEVLMTEKKYRTNSAARRELVGRAVRAIQAWNLKNPENKWCITNKLISELSGVTVKAIARAVEGMDITAYNQEQELEPVINRIVRATVGEPLEVMSIKDVLGVE